MQVKHPDTKISIGALPVLGLGISASPSQALEICNAKSQGRREYQVIQFLNLGIASDSMIPPELIDTLKCSDLSIVVHLEEFNLATTIDEERLQKIMNLAAPLNPLWLEEDLGFWVWEKVNLGAHMLNPILNHDSLSVIGSNITHIIRKSGILFLAENPPIDFSIEEIDLLDFMGRLAAETKCGLVLDIGHFIGYCLATQRDPFQYISNWEGIDYVVEIHLAGYTLYHTSTHTNWFDRHSIRIPSDALDLLGRVVGLAKQLKAITLEQEGATQDVICENIEAVTNVLQRIKP